ncbi:MAG: UbiA-like polyprenyltransferase [Thermodesulfovibrionales bacterium]|nr:UbiA-like polyprenyltransferase [Thermodesulfovibrionales bacterium]
MRCGLSVFKDIVLYLRMIKFSHSVFALPFAFTSALIAADGVPALRQVFWITVAMVGARTGAMGFNRIIDRDIDALNPRTEERELPAGRISFRAALTLSIISFAVLALAAYRLNPLCFKLTPVAIAVVVLYSYTKRFTWASHFVLGLALSAAPLGAWLAVGGKFVAGAFFPALAVLFWIAGFDILYALQDMEFDKSRGLHSIPAKLGIRNSIFLSRFLHLLSWDFLVFTGIIFGLGFYYWAGLIVAAALFIYEHAIIKADDLSRLNKAFFNMNGYISITVFLFTLLNYISK